MKKNEMAKKGTYAGTGAGIVLFALTGFFSGSLIGGAIGLMLSNLIMGEAAGAALLPRMITALSMVAGVMATAGVYIVGLSVVGWVVGSFADALQKEVSTESEAAKQGSH